MNCRPESMNDHDRQHDNQLRGDNTRLLSSPPEEGVLCSALPRTWRKTPPNIRRKRAPELSLARSIPSPCHSAHMRKIFRNASTSLHPEGHIARSTSSSNGLSIPGVIAPSRQETVVENNDAGTVAEIPSEENHFTFTDQLASPLLLHPIVSPNGTRWTTVPFADEPISSRFHSPSFPKQANTQKLANSRYINRSMPKTEPLPPHQTRSSPLRLDETKLVQNFQSTSISDVQCWLDGLYDEPSSDNHEYDDSPSVSREKIEESNAVSNFLDSHLSNGYHHTSRRGINKENMSRSPSTFLIRFPNQHSPPGDKDSDYSISMKSYPSSSTHAGRSNFPLPSTPVLVRKPQKFYTSPRSQGRGQISPTIPRGHSMLPPRRSSSVYSLTQPFEIAEDEDAEMPEKRPLGAALQHRVALAGLRGLSPHVTPFRKGQGPKRSRCPSYYDEDLLQGTRSEKIKEGP